MLVLVSSAPHIWERVIPGGGVHCHWKEPSLATVQERLAVDTTPGPGGTGSSVEWGCRNVIGRSVTNKRGNCIYYNVGFSVCPHVYKAVPNTIIGNSQQLHNAMLQDVMLCFLQPTLKYDSLQTSTN